MARTFSFYLSWYWSTNQYIVHVHKDVKHARWGVLLGGFLKLIPLFIMVYLDYGYQPVRGN